MLIGAHTSDVTRPIHGFAGSRPAIPVLAKLLSHADAGIVEMAASGLAIASDGPNEFLEMVVHTDSIGQLVQLLSHEKIEVITAALRTLGNLATGDDDQTQAVLNHGALLHFGALLRLEPARRGWSPLKHVRTCCLPPPFCGDTLCSCWRHTCARPPWAAPGTAAAWLPSARPGSCWIPLPGAWLA